MADTCITADEDPADPALARTGLPELDEPGAERPRGAILGRYTILNRLGAGAMGVVYLAHDVELDRRVAIKLLRAGLADERLRLRLVREAQAMARLNHPNVVTVHDVGVADGQVFVAMEEVRGVTLRAWLDERRRGWREVVEIFLMVGRGLSAAHAGGIVHRDFKPDNVMVDVDGRPRVMDFGLARAEAEVEAPGSEAPLDAASASWSSESSPLRVTLTQAGAILGTPSYMAPELWVGAVADARSDQFSFCVALWEALYGERPFAAASLAGLISAVTQGSPAAPKDPGRAPARVHRALLRGLARDPADRWPTLDALISTLERERRRPGQRWGLGIAAFALGVAALGLGGSRVADVRAAEAKDATCRAKADALHPEWDGWATARAFAALPKGASATDVKILRNGIAEFEGALRGAQYARREVCREPADPTLAAPWIEPQIDRCFARIAHDLELASRRLWSGDVSAIHDLRRRSPAGMCASFGSVVADETLAPEDPAALARWRELRTRLDDLRIAEGTLDRAALDDAYRALLADAKALEPALEREVTWTFAEHLFLIGSPRRAREALDRVLTAEVEPSLPLPLPGIDDLHLGLHLALGAPSGDARIGLAVRLVVGGGAALDARGSLAGLLWRAHRSRPNTAELTWRDLGMDRPAFQRHQWLTVYDARQEARAALLVLAGDPALARSHALKGLEIADDRPRPRGSVEGSLYLSLGQAELRLGHLDEADAALSAALVRADPSQVAAARRGQVLLAIAELALARGDLGGAARRVDEAAALTDEASADDEAYPLLVEVAAAHLEVRRGAVEGARARLLRVRRGLVESDGFLRLRLAEVDGELAGLDLADGRLDDVDERVAEALAIRRQVLGEDTIASAPLLDLRAEAESARGDAAAAAATRAEAAAIRGPWEAQQAQRERACRPLAEGVHALDTRDPRARAALRPLYEACEAAGVAGFDLDEVGKVTGPR